MADRIGQQLGNYQLQRVIGTGGFAEVYLAEHKYLRTKAAIKILHAQLANDDQEYFLAEARTVAHLIHPHIIRVLEFGIESATPFLVMDYAPNGTLRQLHPKGTRVPLATVVSYVRQLAEALDYAHSQQVIHRDIKPENMLVGSKNDVLLSDFGIAQVAQSSRYQNVRDMAGTIAYMAPEQISAHPRIASDQYSLGIVVYEWLTGERPFQGSFTEIAVKHNLVPPPSFYQKVPGLTVAVEEVVLTALAKEPQQRFATISAFAHALEQASLSMDENSAPTLYEPIVPIHTVVPVLTPPPVRIQNPVTPILFYDDETVMSEPNIALEFDEAAPRVAAEVEPTPMAATELALPAVPSVPVPSTIPAEKVTTTDPIRRKSPSRGRVFLVLALVLLVLVGSTGIYFTVFAHRASTGKTFIIVTKAPSVVSGSPTIVPTNEIVAQDTFQRGDQTFWGTSSDGQQWREEANSKSFFLIKNQTGQVVAPDMGAFNALLGPVRNNEDIVFTGSVNHFAQNVNTGAVVRWTDEGDWYKALIDGQHLAIIKHVHGVASTISSIPFAAQDGVSYSLHFRIVGTTLYANVWQSNQQEPKTWMLTGTDSTFATTQGYGGLRFSVVQGTVVTVTSFRAAKAHPAA